MILLKSSMFNDFNLFVDNSNMQFIFKNVYVHVPLYAFVKQKQFFEEVEANKSFKQNFYL